MALPSEQTVVRKRRPYKRSRQGCRNCKMRSVKCDETKPRCRRCSDYGVLCNYDPGAPDLQVSEATMQRRASELACAVQKQQQQAPISPLRLRIQCSDETVSFEMDPQSLAAFERFRSNTMQGLSSPDMVHTWEKVLLQDSFESPFLMHTVLAAAAAHDRYLHGPQGGRRGVAEVYHASQSAVLLSRKLAQPARQRDLDALWAAAALLSINAFAAFDAASPAEAWPLRAEEPSDLEWLALSEGKMAVWRLTNPLRAGSAFHGMAADYARLYTPLPAVGVDGVPPALARACGLAQDSTAESSPYFTAAHSLAILHELRGRDPTTIEALTFLSHLPVSFKNLLRRKDPVALLLLALWYGRAAGAVWWIERRARVEGQAILLYLQRYHGDDSRLTELLPGLLGSVA